MTAAPGPAGRILRVGLTGNIAAGKSTVGQMLAERGCFVLDADALGHACMQPGTEAFDEIVADFGDGVVAADGRIDRSALAARVFGDDEARARLNGILHPRIRRREDRDIQRWAATVDAGVAVTEAALLVEAGSVDRYHRLVVVVAPDAVRLERLMRDGLSRGEAQSRMAAQLAQERKAELADYLIDNGGDPTGTASQMDELAGRLQEDLAALRENRPLPRR